MKQGDKKEEGLQKELAVVRQQVVEPRASDAEFGQTAEVLKRERDLLSAILDTAGALVVVLDRQGRIVRFNRACERTTGYASDEVDGRFFWDFLLIPEEVEPVRAVFASLQAGQFPNQYENYWVTKDGNHRLIVWSNTALLDSVGSVEYVVGTGIDITGRKEAEDALRQSEEKYRSLFEHANDSIFIVDPSTRRILEANENAAKRLGYKRAEILELTIDDIDTPLAAARNDAIMQELEEGGAVVFEHAHRRKDGTEMPVEISGRIIEYGGERVILSFVRDITRRKRAAEELSKLSLAIEQSPSTVVITNTQGRIEYANPRFTKLTGYVANEVLGLTPRFLKSGEHPPEFYQELWDVIAAGGEWRGEFANRKRNGELYWELASISPIRNARGVTTHYVKVAEDITARKEMEEALRQRTIELLARNEDLDAFAHTVAHDLQSPLSLIIGFAELLEHDHATMSAESLSESLRIIARSGRKMSNIIAELLLLSSVRKMDIERVALDMASIVAEAQQRLADMIEEYQAEIVLPDTWPVAWGYASWVEEAWVNYVSNAIRYGGRPPRVELGASMQADGMVRFWVQDNGPGLTPEEQAELFAPFTHLGRTRAEGHGLGLSIVRRIVDKLGGQVGVESEGLPGRGSVFTFTLPGADREA